MPHEYQLTLTIQDTGEEISLSGTFENSDWEVLEAFVQYADELIKTKWVQDGMASRLNIRYDQTSGMEVTAELPAWDDVIVFLHKFRPLGLQSESTNFYRVCNVLAREITHPYYRTFFEQQRELYSGKTTQAKFRMSLNDVLINSEKMLFDWLNAYEYHRDREKQEFIKSLHQMLPLEASKVIFLGLLADKVQAISNLGEVVLVVLGKRKSIDIVMKRPD
jgi:hypothetical protein